MPPGTALIIMPVYRRTDVQHAFFDLQVKFCGAREPIIWQRYVAG